MNTEQKLIRKIKEHADVRAIRHLCDEMKDLNQVIRIPIPDGSGHSFTTTFLMLAIDHGNPDAVEVLLQKGADPNFVNGNQHNADALPLYKLSVFTGELPEEAIKQLTITKLLLEYGADPEMMLPNGDQTVYDYAKENCACAYDPSSDYDYRYDHAFLELLEAGVHHMLDRIDLKSLLSSR